MPSWVLQGARSLGGVRLPRQASAEGRGFPGEAGAVSPPESPSLRSLLCAGTQWEFWGPQRVVPPTWPEGLWLWSPQQAFRVLGFY